ncbi:MAG: hypothetical protein ROO76_07200 [Terriglobia bacterium]|nr:hypothetical protein [Terriglobia bacterium]
MPLVFQYGSNCDANRLNASNRLQGDATDCGQAETIEEFEIAFDVFSQFNGCAASDLIAVPGTGRRARGVLYDIPADLIRGKRRDGRKTLTQIEGPRYEEHRIQVRNSAGKEVEAVTFLVKKDDRRTGLWTSAEYVGHIVTGLRANDVAEEYIQRVIETAIRTNGESTESAAEQTQLIEQLRSAGQLSL